MFREADSRRREGGLAELVRARGDELLRAWAVRRDAGGATELHGGPDRAESMARLLTELADALAALAARRSGEAEQPPSPSRKQTPPGGGHGTSEALRQATAANGEDLGGGELSINVADELRDLSLLRDVVLAEGERAGGLSFAELSTVNHLFDGAVGATLARAARIVLREQDALDRAAHLALHDRPLAEHVRQLLGVALEHASAIDAAWVERVAPRRGVPRATLLAGVGLADDQHESPASLRRARRRLGPLTARVFHERRPVALSHVETAELVGKELLGGRSVRALYALPLFDEERLLGVAVCASLTMFELPASQLLLFRHLAARIEASIVEDELRVRERRARARTEEAQTRVESLLLTTDEARRAAERASRAKDEFLATLSHELRTPLNAVLGWLHVLRTGHLDDARRSETLAAIERNARQQSQIIDDLLDVSHMLAGTLRIERRPVRLAGVVERVHRRLLPIAEQKGVGLTLDIDPSFDGAAVSGDDERLGQVVWNLVSNAVKFTPPGGLVAVTLERSPQGVFIVVEDTGQGIDASFLERVFERFSMADASTTRTQGGLGLGLAIVRHLVELHGGTVQATSAGSDRGARFTVELPLLDAQALPQRPAPQRPVERSRPSLAGCRVVVVDDQPDARELLAAVLEEKGAEPRVAANAAEALELVRDFHPDVLVSDIGLPEEDGYALIRKVRALDSERSRVPAVALTAFSGAEDRRRALDAGFQAHVAKPVEPERLVRLVEDLKKAAS